MFLLALLFAIVPPSDVSLHPVWSPDHQVLATTKINERFVTSEGADYTLFLNGRRVYPPKPKHAFFDYPNEHTFRSNLTWSPDGQHLAFTEEVYAWHYIDPYNSDFRGVLRINCVGELMRLVPNGTRDAVRRESAAQ